MDTRYLKSWTRIACSAAALIVLFVIASPTASAQSLGLSGKKIVLDAGHGGSDTGARGDTGIHEKDITLSVTKKLAVLLQEGGAQVRLTRHLDDDLATERDAKNRRRQRADLLGRLRIVQAFEPHMFISVHCNASTSSSWRGAQTLYMPGNEEGKVLAKKMQSAFQEQLANTSRSPAAVKSLFLLKHIDGPAVLAEIGFVSNPQEAQLLKTEAYQDKVALAMYTAVIRYFDDEDKPQSAQTQGGWHRAVQKFLR
ncbi:N-acetylmuramoyl-L-alanine amidase [Alicyclobacillus sp. SO9]|uniref:N-acetylmuramoyl-L-alanine amidase n=1 Tax=Alicyclobacillus sp. SO9 TaxID=2665646 RepID=UPI0018E82825|nr:N-acetylmuramoyl-L-alanine amidase [Alicyclobacillus sp. SO9]